MIEWDSFCDVTTVKKYSTFLRICTAYIADATMSSGGGRDGAGLSHKASVYRAGGKLHFGWDNHAYSIMQNLYKQARVSMTRIQSFAFVKWIK